MRRRCKGMLSCFALDHPLCLDLHVQLAAMHPPRVAFCTFSKHQEVSTTSSINHSWTACTVLCTPRASCVMTAGYIGSEEYREPRSSRDSLSEWARLEMRFMGLLSLISHSAVPSEGVWSNFRWKCAARRNSCWHKAGIPAERWWLTRFEGLFRR